MPSARAACGARRRVLSAIATSIGTEFQFTVQAADLELDLGELREVVGRAKGLGGFFQGRQELERLLQRVLTRAGGSWSLGNVIGVILLSCSSWSARTTGALAGQAPAAEP